MRTTVFLDGAALKDFDDLLDAFSAARLLPETCGRNLDALYDVLSENAAPFDVVIANAAEFHASMGKRADELEKIFVRLKKEKGGAFRLFRLPEGETAYSASALASLLKGSPLPVTAQANAAAYLYHTLPGLYWAGFYQKRGPSLFLSAFQGKPACLAIPMGKGVCGTAAKRKKTVVVPDVHAFPGHIACDADSRSEIVIPLWRGKRFWGVLDLDSPLTGRFSDEDKTLLEKAARIIEKYL